MKLNLKEVESVSKLDAFKRYKYFIKKVADFEELWTVVDLNKDFALSSVEGNTFISFWSAKDFVKNNLNTGWEKCTPFKLDLDDLEETLFPLIKNNNYLINVFPVNGKSGFIINLEEFIRDLNEELENYQ